MQNGCSGFGVGISTPRTRHETRKARAAWLIAASALAALPQAVRAGGNVFWNVNGSGNWNTAGNWNPTGVPGSTDSAIVNEGQPDIGSAGADVFGLTVGDSPGANASVAQSAGTVTIQNFLGVGDFGGGTGAYFLDGGTLYFSSTGTIGMTIGGGFTPTVDFFEQDGGTVQQNPDQKIDVADSGEYVLNSGNCFADNIQVEVGGEFTQQGGVVDTPGALVIAPSATISGLTGAYTLTSGTLDVPSAYVGGSSSASGGGGVLDVDGGTMNCAGLLEVYNTTATNVTLSAGTLNTQTIDFSGNPSLFTWTGGTLHITGEPLDFTTGTDPYNAHPFGATLTLGNGQTLIVDTSSEPWEWLSGSGSNITQNAGSSNTCDDLFVGATGTQATYTLNGGTFSTSGATEYVGYIGTASVGGPGEFDQSGGSNTTGKLIVDYDAQGTYQLSGGTLKSTEIDVDGQGLFHQSAGTLTFTTFNQSGGTVNLDIGLNVTSGKYNLSGGALTTSAITNGGTPANFDWTDGSLTLTDQPVDLTDGSDPVYNGIVFGNTLTLNAGMSLTDSVWWDYLYGNGSSITQNTGSSNSTPKLYVGNTTGSGPADSYNLNGGTLSVTSFAEIGYSGTYSGAGAGAFNQSAGMATMGALTIGADGVGTCNLTGGTLQVTGTEAIGTSGFSGTLTITAGTNTAQVLNNGTIGGVFINGGSLSAATTINQSLIEQNGGTTNLGALSGKGSVGLGGGSGTATMTVTQFTQTEVSISNHGLFTVQPNSGFDNSVTVLLISGSGQLDLENNHMFVDYGTGSDPMASIRQMIINGFNGGAWNGPGIISSAAAANSGSYGIGYADSADPNNPAGLPTDTIEIKYTLLGDGNLDGKVNGTDFAILATNFNQAVTSWDQGDFNYDGKDNGTDFAFLASNFNQGASQSDIAALDAFAAAHGLSADVPEPGMLAVGALLGAGALLRRKRL